MDEAVPVIDAVELIDWLGKDLVSVDQVTRRVVYVSPSAASRLGMPREALLGRSFNDAESHVVLKKLGLDAETCTQIVAAMSGAVGTSVDLEYFSPGEPEGHWRLMRLRVADTAHGPRIDMIGRDIDDLVEAREEGLVADTLREMSEAISYAADVRSAARSIAELVRRHLRTERAGVVIFDDAMALDGTVREIVGEDTPMSPSMMRRLLDRVVDRFGAVGQFAPAEVFADEPVVLGLQMQTMAYSLIGHRERLGAVTASTNKERRLTDRELRFLRHVAERLAGPLAQKALDDQRRRASEELAAAKERMSNALEGSGIGIWELDLKTSTLHCDETCARLWSLGADVKSDVLIRVQRSIVPEDLPLFQQAQLRAQRSNDGRYRLEYRYLVDGVQKNLLQSGRCHFGPDQQPERFVGTLQDVSEARRLEAKLVASQKLESLGVLAGGIAHDFNNLLVGILGNAGLAKMELPAISPANEAIDGIETAALRASELTRQLLAYAGKARYVISTIYLDQLVQEMGHLLTAVIGKGIVLRYQFGHNLPTIRGDATQLRQVVMNLITNASDAIGERSGIVTVSTSLVHADHAYLEETAFDDELEPGDYLCLQVSDTGVGMSAETKARIFEPFFTTKFTGRGLGLAAVQGILRAHHGALKVYSEEGRGTTFKVLLPVADTIPEGETRARPPLTTQPVGSVLVVDDEETMRNVTRRLLNSVGVSVVLASDGLEAVEIYRARQSEIDLVILDVTMPRMGGEEAFRQLRLINPNVRVLLTSGYSEQEATAQFAGKGLVGFVEKPFQVSVLLEKVRQALKV